MPLRYERGEWTVRFVTPAFLGGADQQGEWRVPPFRATLREALRWTAGSRKWRVEELRRREADWFGSASDARRKGSRRSRVEVALGSWRKVKSSRPFELDRLKHPEAKNRKGQPILVRADLYLGYGPIQVHSTRPFLDAGEQAGLRLRWREGDKDDGERLDGEEVLRWLKLLHLVGTLGGRSRNGWGSLELAEEDGTPLFEDPLGNEANAFLRQHAVDWARVVQDGRKWASGVGRDKDGLLRWHTEPKGSWRAAMTDLARVRLAVRTHFRFGRSGTHSTPQKRHVLAYPVTHHAVKGWENPGRFANSLRFKVVRRGEKYFGVITHLPTAVPIQSPRIDREDQLNVWKQVHGLLDRELLDEKGKNAQGVSMPLLHRVEER